MDDALDAETIRLDEENQKENQDGKLYHFDRQRRIQIVIRWWKRVV